MLKRLETAHVETELINFYDYRIIPCHNCSYECVQKHDPQKGINAPCPIWDDVQAIWKQAWPSDILLLFIPTYGGLPPALWVAFTQRIQGFSENPPVDQEQKVVSAVVLASPHWSGPAERTPSIMVDEVKLMKRKIGGFEIINNAGFDTENLFGKLINEEEIKRRLEYLTDRTLEMACDTQNQLTKFSAKRETD